MKNNNRFVFGSILLVLGVLFLIDQLNIFASFNINIWNVISIVWPLVLIYLGTNLLIKEGKNTGGIVLVVLGVLFLGSNVFEVSFFSMFWPFILIAIAISLLIKDDDAEKKINVSKDDVTTDKINEAVIFWGMDKTVISDSFEGGEVTCVFGGGKLDISQVQIAKDGAKLEVNCIFGGAEVIVPKDVNIVTNGTGVFGGWSPKITSTKSSGPKLEISGAAIFGGVEVKN
jgi:predicted membrane protein